MMDKGSKIVLVGMVALGFICAIIFRSDGAAVAGVLGIVAGLLISLSDTLSVSKNQRGKNFDVYTGSGKYGALFKRDSRLIFSIMLGIFSAIVTYLWLFIFALLK